MNFTIVDGEARELAPVTIPESPCPRLDVLRELRALARKEGIAVDSFRLDARCYLEIVKELGPRAIYQCGPDNKGPVANAIALFDDGGNFTVTRAW